MDLFFTAEERKKAFYLENFRFKLFVPAENLASKYEDNHRFEMNLTLQIMEWKHCFFLFLMELNRFFK